MKKEDTYKYSENKNTLLNNPKKKLQVNLEDTMN